MSVSFFDSNVLIYLASGVTDKALAAEHILAVPGAVVSTQVVNECASVLRRKYRHDWNAIRDFVDMVAAVASIRPISFETSRRGLILAERYGFSVWDSMIVAAAIEADATTLWTEDLHDGLIVDERLRIANPFSLLP